MLILLIASACHEKKNADFSVDKVPDPMQHNDYVSNPDHLISDATEQTLNAQMRQLDQSGRAQIAIVVLETIGDKVPKDIAHELFRLWKPGQKEKNNGLVVLLVNDQHRIEFETGYGLEGDLPDVVCYRIQQSEMLPSFKQKDLDGGMIKGMTAVINVLNNTDVAQGNAQGNTATEDDGLSDTAIAALDAAGVEDNAVPTDSVYSPQTLVDVPAADPQIVTNEGEEYTAPPEEVYDVEKQGDEMGVGTLVLYVFYAIFSTIFVIQTGNAKRRKKALYLFRNNFMHIIWIYALPFLLTLALINFTSVVYRWWMLPLIMYGNLLAYLIYRTIVVHAKAAFLLKDADRRQQYDAWNLANKSTLIAGFFFPLPFLIYSKWHKKRLEALRYEPYACENCQQEMTILKKKEKQQFLNSSQQAEDKIGSVIYDVWNCKQCSSRKVLGYQDLDVNAEECTACNAITMVPGKKKTIRRATSSRDGEGIQYYDCKHCNHTKQEYYVIAKPSSSSSSSSGSSSSSSSSSSWGGGSSGGGGAGSSW